jgi:hypothetical protein
MMGEKRALKQETFSTEKLGEHINKPFEVCLLMVLPLQIYLKTKEKVVSEQGLNHASSA